LALYQLNSRQLTRLGEVSFVRIADVDFDSDLSKGYFVLSGFPRMWSTTSDRNSGPMKSRLLQFGTQSFCGSTAALESYDPSWHFLLEARPGALCDEIGASTTFKTRSGHPAQIPADLGGISGCSVWFVGNLREPANSWTRNRARIVGVETAVFPSRGAIKATRWKAVTTVIHEAFPRLRSALELYA
jgi:hypothetical protein